MKSKGGSFDLSKLFSIEWLISELKEVYFVVLVTSFLFAASFFFYKKMQVRPSFEANAIIMPKLNKGSDLMEGFLSQLGSNGLSNNLLGGIGNINSELQQFYRLLRTRNLTLKALDIDNFGQKIFKSGDSEDPEVRKEVLVARMAESLNVKIEGNVIDLRFRAPSPDLALEGIQAYLNALQGFLNENIITQTKNAELFIKERLEELARSLDAAESKLMALKMGRRNPDHPERSIQSEISRTEREQLRITQLLELLAKQYELAQIESKRSDPMFVVLDPPFKPTKPIGISSKKYAFIGAFLGFLISFLFMIFMRNFRKV